MQKLLLLTFLIFSSVILAQKPCNANPKHNEFDFWIGEWDVKSPTGQPAGKSKIE